MLDKKSVDEIFQIFTRNNPTPTTELHYINNYTLLVAVLLSARATDKIVNKATEELFKIANTPHKMLLLGEKDLKNHIKIIGLYPTKAKNIISLSERLISEFGGEVPDKLEDLEKLPGIGRKSANVVLNTIFHQPTIPVDTHVFRVARRLDLSDGNNVLKVEKDLMKIVPQEYLQNAHHWLVLHGRYVCKARKPLCNSCPISHLCKYFSALGSVNNFNF
jgi:endonuclease-3